MNWDLEPFTGGCLSPRAPYIGVEDEIDELLRSVERFARSGHQDVATSAAELHRGLEEHPPTIKWKPLVSLSRWCHTAGPYKTSREAARDLSLALFGEVLPNLGRDERDPAGRRLTANEARQLAARFFRSRSAEADSRSLAANLRPELYADEFGDGERLIGARRLLHLYLRDRNHELALQLMGSSTSMTLFGAGLDVWNSVPVDTLDEGDIDYGQSMLASYGTLWPLPVPVWDLTANVMCLGVKGGGDGLVLAQAVDPDGSSGLPKMTLDESRRVDALFASAQRHLKIDAQDWKRPEIFDLASRLTLMALANEVDTVATWITLVYFYESGAGSFSSHADALVEHRSSLARVGLKADSGLIDRVVPLFLKL